MVHLVPVTVSWPTTDHASTDYDLHLSVSVADNAAWACETEWSVGVEARP